MNIERAWEEGATGRGVVISILDDGIEHTHPDLHDNYVSPYIIYTPPYIVVFFVFVGKGCASCQPYSLIFNILTVYLHSKQGCLKNSGHPLKYATLVSVCSAYRLVPGRASSKPFHYHQGTCIQLPLIGCYDTIGIDIV